jgi:hypothetical protein
MSQELEFLVEQQRSDRPLYKNLRLLQEVEDLVIPGLWNWGT